MRPHCRTSRLTRFAATLAALFAVFSALAPVVSLAAVNAVEYQLKAGFLFNFAKYIEWPPAAVAPGTPLRLGIMAPDDAYAVMEKALAGKQAGLHPIRVERVTAEQLTQGADLPNLLFVHQDILRHRQDAGLGLPELRAAAENHSFLLVGESAGFAPSGGMIGFVQRGENLRFQVNLASARRAGLKLSARLSGLAEMVVPQ